jgi:hypothetical protein
MNPKIFVSSTCFDLIDFRAEVYVFLKEAGLSPVMSDEMISEFEIFGDKNSIETCLINLRSCDTVVIILSQRYGPSLVKAGFADVSATHLEYLEAVKEKKNILMYVRDRLEADFNIYGRDARVDQLKWVKPEDVKLFDMVRQHKKLANDERNNWYWTFKSSVDVKASLAVQLKKSIAEVRLNDLIRSGNLPFVIIEADVDLTSKHKGLHFKLTAENVGSNPAIEPWVFIYETNDYEKVLAMENAAEDEATVYYESIGTLKPGEKSARVEFKLDFDDAGRKSIGTHYFLFEVVYVTTQGDYLSDITEYELIIDKNGDYKDLTPSKSYLAKRYRGQDYFKRIIKE